MRPSVAFVFLSTTILSACGGNLYSVSETKGGIPFHPTQQYTVVTKVYREDVHVVEVAFQLLKDGDPKKVLRELSEAVYTRDAKCASDLIEAFSKDPTASEGYLAFRGARSAASCTNARATPIPQRTWSEMNTLIAAGESWVGQATEERTRLEHRAQYINVDKAAIGTTSGTIKVNEKGQLTEATASSDEKTASTIIEAAGTLAGLASGQLPLKELLLDKWGLNPAETKSAQTFMGAPAAPKPEDVHATLRYSLRVRLYSVECEVGTCNPPLAFSVKEVAPAAAEKTDGDADKIEFSGAVKLPKAKDGK